MFWIVIIGIVILVLVLLTIRGSYIQKHGIFQVVEPTGKVLYEGGLEDCQRFQYEVNKMNDDIAKMMNLRSYCTIRRK